MASNQKAALEEFIQQLKDAGLDGQPVCGP